MRIRCLHTKKKKKIAQLWRHTCAQLVCSPFSVFFIASSFPTRYFSLVARRSYLYAFQLYLRERDGERARDRGELEIEMTLCRSLEWTYLRGGSEED